MGHWRAYFNDKWCLSLTGTAHEFGHLLGLEHSGKGVGSYDDLTDYMAGGYLDMDFPQKAFNGVKNWQLGFYSDRQTTIRPLVGAARTVKLAAFVDYDLTNSGEYVVINVADTYFLEYNLATKFNADVEEKQNQTTITEIVAGGESNSVAGLSTGDEFKVPDFKGSGRELIIKVCESKIGGENRPYIMTVSIGMDIDLCQQESGFGLSQTMSSGSAGVASVEATCNQCVSIMKRSLRRYIVERCERKCTTFSMAQFPELESDCAASCSAGVEASTSGISLQDNAQNVCSGYC